MKKYILILSLLFIYPAFSSAQGDNGEQLPEVAPQSETQVEGPPRSDESEENTDIAESEVEDAEEVTESSEIDGPREIRQLTNLISFNKIFLSLLILIAAWFTNSLFNTIFDNLAERTTNYRLFIKRLTPVVRILIWSFALYIVIAGVISPPFETIITISASIGIAVGFASQDILRNIFGGIMIILDRPFQVGDKIQVGEHYGEVTSVGLRSCLIETPDDSIVAIPNGELMNRAVSNANTSALDCQAVSEIFIPATADVNLAKDIAIRAVYSSPYLYLNKPVVVNVINELHNRHFILKMRVKAYVLDIRYEFLFNSDVTEMIITELNKHGIIPKYSEFEDDVR